MLTINVLDRWDKDNLFRPSHTAQAGTTLNIMLADPNARSAMGKWLEQGRCSKS